MLCWSESALDSSLAQRRGPCSRGRPLDLALGLSGRSGKGRRGSAGPLRAGLADTPPPPQSFTSQLGSHPDGHCCPLGLLESSPCVGAAQPSASNPRAASLLFCPPCSPACDVPCPAPSRCLRSLESWLLPHFWRLWLSGFQLLAPGKAPHGRKSEATAAHLAFFSSLRDPSPAEREPV